MTTLALMMLMQNPETRVYEDRELNLAFDYPSAWRRTNTNTGVVFEIPLSNNQRARVTMLRSEFRGPQDEWQQLNRDAALARREEIVSQTPETLLTVPLLLLKTRSVTDQGPTVTLAGLLYTNTRFKLNFRLTAPELSFDEAEAAWRGTWTSWRTLDNRLPSAEGTVTPPVVEPPKPPTVMYVGGKLDATATTTVAATTFTEKTVAQEGGDVKLALADGWEMVQDESVWRLRHPDLKGSLTVALLAGDAAFVPQLLNLRAGESLRDFQVVRLRRDGVVPNERGARVAFVARAGSGSAGALAVIDVAGGQSGGAFAMRYRSTQEGALDGDLALIQSLLKVFGRIVPAAQ